MLQSLRDASSWNPPIDNARRPIDICRSHTVASLVDEVQITLISCKITNVMNSREIPARKTWDLAWNRPGFDFLTTTAGAVAV